MGAVVWRPPFLLILAALLVGSQPAIAEENEPDDPAEVRHGIPLAGFPTTSVIRMEMPISLHGLVQRLEAGVPRRVGSSDQFFQYNDSLDVRYHIERDSLTLVLNGYDFKLTFHANYWLETRARGIPDFGEARCGTSEKPISILMGYRGRIGWKDGWRLAMRVAPEADVFSFRCKPKPPTHNFTKFLEQQVQQTFADTLGVLLRAEMDRFDEIRPPVQAAWNALLETRSLFEDQVWLDWNPVTIEADPAGGQGEVLNLRLSFITDPSIRVGARGTMPARPLPDPVVRVAEDHVRIPVDVSLPLQQIGEHVLTSFRSANASFPRDMTLRLGGSGNIMTVEILPAGAASSGIVLSGKVLFNEEVSGLLVRGLAWQPGSVELMAKQFPGLNPELFRARLEIELSLDIHNELTNRKQLLPRAVNHDFGNGVTSMGAITHFIPGEPVVTDSVLMIRHLALGTMWLTARSDKTPGR